MEESQGHPYGHKESLYDRLIGVLLGGIMCVGGAIGLAVAWTWTAHQTDELIWGGVIVFSVGGVVIAVIVGLMVGFGFSRRMHLEMMQRQPNISIDAKPQQLIGQKPQVGSYGRSLTAYSGWNDND